MVIETCILVFIATTSSITGINGLMSLYNNIKRFKIFEDVEDKNISVRNLVSSSSTTTRFSKKSKKN